MVSIVPNENERMEVGFKNPQMRLNGNGGETDYKLCIMLKDII